VAAILTAVAIDAGGTRRVGARRVSLG
jgi:hypothetical protein